MSRKKQVYEKITALYCRISLDDGGDNESMSIKPMFLRRNTVSLRSSMAKMSLPSISTLPVVGVSSAPIMFSSVLLPEPDSPTTATYSPLGTEKLTFS